MNAEFAKILREKFEEGLKVKTGWGKNEVLALFDRCLAEAACEVADRYQERGR